MKRLKYYFTLAALLIVAASCSKHEITFTGQQNVDEKTSSMFILHYFVPVVSGAANNITKVELDGEIIFHSDILPFNAAPSGAAGKFFTTTPGSHNVKLYTGTASTGYVLKYDNTFALQASKYYNVFVHNLNEAPTVLDNGFPYTLDPVDADSCGYVNFYNFLYETDTNTPTTLRLQYKRQDHFTNEWVNVGDPVRFGECTGWQSVVIKRPTTISSGYATVYYRIYVVDDNGNEIGRLQKMNSAGNMANYSDYWTCYIGRRAMHIFSGFRLQKTPSADVRNFWSLS